MTNLHDKEKGKKIDDCVCRCHIEGGFCRACMAEKCSFWREPPTEEKTMEKFFSNKKGELGRLGAYLNTMVSDLEIDNKGQYLRDLFSDYETEAKALLASSQDSFRRKVEGLVEAVNYDTQKDILNSDRQYHEQIDINRSLGDLTNEILAKLKTLNNL